MAEPQLSAQAKALAHKLARAQNSTVTKVVEDALTEYEARHRPVSDDGDHDFWRPLTPLMERGRKAAQDRNMATSDHADLYDEYGLPA